MPSPSTKQRRALILRLLDVQNVRSQAALQDLLHAEGVETTQATLSRDLRELSVAKGPQGYVAPGQLTAADPDAAEQALERAAGQWLLRVSRAQNQLVLHTPAGGAQPLAVALDRAQLPGTLGTIGGDDTILTICDSAASAKRVEQQLLKHLGTHSTTSAIEAAS